MKLPTFGLCALAVLGGSAVVAAQPARTLDLAAVSPDDGVVRRIYGATGTGRLGVPVTGGSDCDGDAHPDYAVAYFTADPPDPSTGSARNNAGEIDLVFGDGTLRGSLDTSVDDPSLLRFIGAGPQETAGNEVWMDDVTGDGLGDLVIGRQNMTPDGSRIGAGALTIVAGGPALRQLAAQNRSVDLASPPEELLVTTFIGAAELDRLGIWMRTGDVNGDGVADIVVGADQEDLELPPPSPQGAAILETNRGAVYVIRGGAHLAESRTVDLADFGSTPLAGHIAKVTPPPGSERYHFGSTCLIADLDGNGRGEVLVSAALLRGGATVMADGASLFSAEADGGSDRGTVFIAWDDNFSGSWAPGFAFDISESPGSRTTLDGGDLNLKFGEELVGGLDYDGDGNADLFVGDLVGGEQPERSRPGIGHVFYSAAELKGRGLDLSDFPADLRMTTILGPSEEAIGSDTAAQGDFDGDGRGDLAVAAPYAHPQDRFRAGVFHVLFGRPGGWPEVVDTHPENLPDPGLVRIVEIQGARGAGDDRGDTLGYSADAADLDGDGKTDLITNEMLGNGLAPGAVDVGNMVLVDGAALSGLCRATPSALCLQGERFAVTLEWADFDDNRGTGQVVPVGSDDSGLFWFFSPDNWEILVKVLDGCGVNGHFWVFAAATTNVEYTLRVTDSETGEERSYLNPLGTSAAAITDTGAFAGCPADAEPR